MKDISRPHFNLNELHVNIYFQNLVVLNCATIFPMLFIGSYCPVIFDSWTCWNASLPDTAQVQPCPDFIDWGWGPTKGISHKKDNKDTSG